MEAAREVNWGHGYVVKLHSGFKSINRPAFMEPSVGFLGRFKTFWLLDCKCFWHNGLPLERTEIKYIFAPAASNIRRKYEFKSRSYDGPNVAPFYWSPHLQKAELNPLALIEKASSKVCNVFLPASINSLKQCRHFRFLKYLTAELIWPLYKHQFPQEKARVFSAFQAQLFVLERGKNMRLTFGSK